MRDVLAYPLNLDELDSAAANFHDYPCYATADRYARIAIDYAANMIISTSEIKSIVRLVSPFLGETNINVIWE